jgi:hypothetical protein
MKVVNNGLTITIDGAMGHFPKEFVVSALEKQIPKKPIENRYPWAICPICGGSVYLENVQEHIMNQEKTHCEHCGQALDWSEEE